MGNWRRTGGTQRGNNKTFSRWFVVLIAGCCALSGLAYSQSLVSSSAQVVITVFDEAGVGRGVVVRAEAQVEQDLRSSKLAVYWRNPGWQSSRQDSRGIAMPGEPLRLYLHILPGARSAAGEVFGMAFLDAEGSGQQADLFYDRISRLGEHFGQDRARLLSAVMAHELGHLLLGTHAHAATGIMQARWDDEAVRQISEGLAGFSPEQGARMLERVEFEQAALNAKLREEKNVLKGKQESASDVQKSAPSSEEVVLRAAR